MSISVLIKNDMHLVEYKQFVPPLTLNDVLTINGQLEIF